MNDGRPRVGLVLGAGGVAGLSFHAGVLAALEEATGWDPRQAAVVVGTSAGSIAATTLRAGLSSADLLARFEDRPPSAAGRQLFSQTGTVFANPPEFRLAGGVRPAREVAARLARAAVRPLAARPMALLAGLVPEGAGDTQLIADGMSGLIPGSWSPHPLLICAVQESNGRRVVFGRDRYAPVHQAVAASCAVPAFYRPVTIGGDAFIDGGVHSPTNADVLEASDLDLVVVSSPMSMAGRPVRLAMDQPLRRWSRLLLDVEARQLRRRGVHVIAFQPTPEDAAVMGLNAMDSRRGTTVARQARQSTLRRLGRDDTRARMSAIFIR